MTAGIGFGWVAYYYFIAVIYLAGTATVVLAGIEVELGAFITFGDSTFKGGLATLTGVVALYTFEIALT